MTQDPGDALLAALTALDGLKVEIARLTAREDGDFRYDVIQLRRQIADQLAGVGAAGEAAFAGSADLAMFRTKFSTLRAVTATHQANWPAVLLGERRDEFAKSVEPMRIAGAEFSAWVHDAVRRRKRPANGR